MRELPILFSGPLVRAILEGRKTQTRRVVKGEPLAWLDGAGFEPAFVASPENHFSRYGYAGDRLWVRESFWHLQLFVDGEYEGHQFGEAVFGPSGWVYGHPDHHDGPLVSYGDAEPTTTDDHERWVRRPSIHMPRWASRIDLEVTDVRIERLQAITDEDAIAEGIERSPNGHPEHIRFAELWDSINGKREGAAWADDPWVWVVSFRVAGEVRHG